MNIKTYSESFTSFLLRLFCSARTAESLTHTPEKPSWTLKWKCFHIHMCLKLSLFSFFLLYVWGCSRSVFYFLSWSFVFIFLSHIRCNLPMKKYFCTCRLVIKGMILLPFCSIKMHEIHYSSVSIFCICWINKDVKCDISYWNKARKIFFFNSFSWSWITTKELFL